MVWSESNRPLLSRSEDNQTGLCWAGVIRSKQAWDWEARQHVKMSIALSYYFSIGDVDTRLEGNTIVQKLLSSASVSRELPQLCHLQMTSFAILLHMFLRFPWPLLLYKESIDQFKFSKMIDESYFMFSLIYQMLLNYLFMFRVYNLWLSYRYLVTQLMGADLNNIVKTQKLTDDHVQFLIYQILRGLKVNQAPLRFFFLWKTIL